MISFIAEKVQKLNELEHLAFDFILQHTDEAQAMSVRELSEKVHVSTATVMRMTKKLGFSGWSELCFYLKNKEEELQDLPVSYHENLLQLNIFLKNISEKDYAKRLEQAISLVKRAQRHVFIGVGTSGSLAVYGAGYFVNSGLESYAITDLHQSMRGKSADGSLIIVLSVSGETELLIKSLLVLKSEGAKIISITNHEDTTISKLSDINLSYNFQDRYSDYDIQENLTSQLPVVALIEMLAQEGVKK
ncbi:MurR/RpiR family transcriptional regulator [Lactococcus nasutitermitis]|uniref:MurR/RpiR family transcriptional regulator n=1 Tax=Lactococcus nasutitermitis TaxID=1652957 RepID=A0ABV9JDR8_9LACT|nr:MurR/RpiR family transcriptional regulator [Lactococcus nasutitermitis]